MRRMETRTDTTESTPEPWCISIAETARLLAIGETLARTLIRSGEIPSIRLGGRIVVPVEQLRARFDELTAS